MLDVCLSLGLASCRLCPAWGSGADVERVLRDAACLSCSLVGSGGRKAANLASQSALDKPDVAGVEVVVMVGMGDEGSGAFASFSSAILSIDASSLLVSVPLIVTVEF